MKCHQDVGISWFEEPHRVINFVCSIVVPDDAAAVVEIFYFPLLFSFHFSNSMDIVVFVDILTVDTDFTVYRTFVTYLVTGIRLGSVEQTSLMLSTILDVLVSITRSLAAEVCLLNPPTLYYFSITGVKLTLHGVAIIAES